MKNKDDLGTSINAFENEANSRVDIELNDGDEIRNIRNKNGKIKLSKELIERVENAIKLSFLN